MDEKELRAWATQEHTRLEAIRREAAIDALVTQRRETEARAEIHQRLCAKHGLKPESTSPKTLARAERAYASSWTSFVASRYANAVRVLDPETHANSAEVQTYLALRDKLRKQFEASWPPQNLAAQIGEGVTDGTETLFAHATRAA